MKPYKEPSKLEEFMFKYSPIRYIRQKIYIFRKKTWLWMKIRVMQKIIISINRITSPTYLTVPLERAEEELIKCRVFLETEYLMYGKKKVYKKCKCSSCIKIKEKTYENKQ